MTTVSAKTSHRAYVPVLVTAAVLAVLAYVLSSFYVFMLNEILLLSIVALSLNLLLGYSGMISFGHAAYYGLGAYACGLLLVKAQWGLLPALIGGTVIAAVTGAVISLFVVHRGAVYFAMLTLAVGQILHTIIFKWYDFTGGDNGLVGIPRPPLDLGLFSWDLTEPRRFLVFTVIVWSGLVLLMKTIVDSPFGLLCQSVRDSQERVEFLGLRVRRHLMVVYTLAAGFAGASGALFAVFQQAIFPNLLNWTTSGSFLFMSLLGGIYHFVGPLVGTVAFVALDMTVSGYTEYRPLFMGVLLALLVLFFPRGIVGALADWQLRRRLRRAQQIGSYEGATAHVDHASR